MGQIFKKEKVLQPSKDRFNAIKHHSLQTELFTLPGAKMSARFYAFLIDCVFFSAISEGVTFLTVSAAEIEDRDLVILSTSVVLSFLYFVAPIRKWGYTPGKRALGLRVLSRRTDKSLGLRILTFRHFIGLPLSVLPLGLGYLMGAISKEKLTLHDRLSGTKVIQEEVD